MNWSLECVGELVVFGVAVAVLGGCPNAWENQTAIEARGRDHPERREQESQQATDHSDGRKRWRDRWGVEDAEAFLRGFWWWELQ